MVQIRPTVVNAGPLAISLYRSEQAHKKMAAKAEAYWKSMGHEVKFTVVFNQLLNIHELRSQLVSGLPTEELTLVAKRQLTVLYAH